MSADNNSEKIAVNFYLSTNAIEKIDDFLFYVKKRLPVEKRRKLTRSIFYEIGLKAAIEEYNKKGEDSALWIGISQFLKE